MEDETEKMDTMNTSVGVAKIQYYELELLNRPKNARRAS